MVDFRSIKRGELKRLRSAASKLMDSMQAMQRKNLHVLSALIGAGREPKLWSHYPDQDAYDPATGFRYFYHCHPGPGSGREHGHFHLFARAPRTAGSSRFTHLVAISMSSHGIPLKGFTTNRWVTDEYWQPAAAVKRLLDRFSLEEPRHLTLVHRWIEAVVQLFRPQINALLERRDRRYREALRKRPNFHEDRRSVILSQCTLDLSRQVEWLDRLLPASG